MEHSAFDQLIDMNETRQKSKKESDANCRKKKKDYRLHSRMHSQQRRAEKPHLLEAQKGLNNLHGYKRIQRHWSAETSRAKKLEM
jgi:hypothetical protein